jgi:predicted nuclease of predicted toxin-antitoxin system
MEASPDEAILDRAAAEDRVLISADTDFGEILALRSEVKPSLMLLRLPNWKPTQQLRLIEAVLPEVELNLNEGAVVVIELGRVRIRPLPIVD